MGSGKDTVGSVLQYLTAKDTGKFCSIRLRDGLSIDGHHDSKFVIKKFANKLKDITCMLIGCTREQLEDANFKNTELGEDWWYWKENITGKIVKPYFGEEINDFILVKLTPRLLLQLFGTDCGRDIIHPNIWVNSLMNEYSVDELSREEKIKILKSQGTEVKNDDWSEISTDYLDRVAKPKFIKGSNWIITDCRFPNELEAVKNKGGITIKVIRPHGYTNPHTGEYKEIPISFHSSETALDDSKFDFTIINDGSIDELILKVKDILKSVG